ncbi:MAG: diguanylate cyclase, partial [Mesorhizobium sp.]
AILTEQPHAVARLLGESIRHAVKASASTSRFELTVSVGVCTLGEASNCLADIFALADKRLYKAKLAGRDRVIGELGDDEAQDPGIRTRSA